MLFLSERIGNQYKKRLNVFFLITSASKWNFNVKYAIARYRKIQFGSDDHRIPFSYKL